MDTLSRYINRCKVILMKKTSMFMECMEISINLIYDVVYMCETRLKSTYFTRGGIMSFEKIILFALNFVKRSLKIELSDFSKLVNGEDIGVTKQAYSEARQKISPTAFTKLNDAILSRFYRDNDHKTYKGYRLSAIDGSVLEISNTEVLRQAFGCNENKSVKLARALASGLYDVQNNMMMVSHIGRYNSSERDFAVILIEKLKALGLKNDLILFDRGYPSSKLISYLEESKIKYVMRVSGAFFKAVVNAKQQDQIIEVEKDSTIIKMRVLKFKLDSGIEETLISNIFDETFTFIDFKELYFKRWGIEVKYNELKNRLQIENFTGETPIAIEQDFYASIYLSNMVALAKEECNQEIANNNLGKELKFEYKANTNVLIGYLKNALIIMMLEKSRKKRAYMFKIIMNKIKQDTVPVRPGRSYPRNMNLKANKYSHNKKRSL